MRSGPTLMNFGPYLPFGEGKHRATEALAAGKLVAVILGAAILGLVFALYPLRATGATRLDVVLVAMALLAQGATYAAATLSGTSALARLLPLGALLAAPALVVLPAYPMAQASLATLIALGAAMEACLLAGQRRLMVPLLAFCVPALVALGVAAPLFGALAAGLLTVIAPVVALFHRSPAREQATPRRVETDAAAMGAALLSVALAPEGRRLLVTDQMGKIDEALAPGSMEVFPEGSLTEATLIADRVALLHALSEASRGGQVQPLTLRLRQGHGGAGYPGAAHFEPHVLRFCALAGAKGRVGVLIEPATRHESDVAAVATGGNPAQLARALHDGLAPFNAGMGFLEMVADPRLAPRDFTALHDFAAEAHKAMGEAHRNAVLMGLWMRMMQDENYARARGELAPRRLLTEVLRQLNLEDMEKRADLMGDESFDVPVSYTMPVNAVRFAFGTLLRFGMGAAHIDLSVNEDGADLVITLTRREGGDHAPMADAFQHALEEAAMRGGDIVFESVSGNGRRLRLRGVAANRRVADVLRIAS